MGTSSLELLCSTQLNGWRFIYRSLRTVTGCSTYSLLSALHSHTHSNQNIQNKLGWLWKATPFFFQSSRKGVGKYQTAGGRWRTRFEGRENRRERERESKGKQRPFAMYLIDLVLMLVQPTLYIFFAALSLAQFQIL